MLSIGLSVECLWTYAPEAKPSEGRVRVLWTPCQAILGWGMPHKYVMADDKDTHSMVVEDCYEVLAVVLVNRALPVNLLGANAGCFDQGLL